LPVPGKRCDSVAVKRRPREQGGARTLIWQSFGLSYTGDTGVPP